MKKIVIEISNEAKAQEICKDIICILASKMDVSEDFSIRQENVRNNNGDLQVPSFLKGGASLRGV